MKTSLALLRQQGAVSLPRALTIGSGVCTALDAVHRSGAIYGRLSPETILFDPDRRDVTLDPGRPGPHRITAYTSPEQTGRMNRSLDYRTDFYSLGATLYELVTGSRPFDTTDPLELIHAHIARIPTAMASAAPEVPAQVAAIVSRLMAKAAEDRYRSALGIKHDLDRCLDEWTTRGTVSAFDLAQSDVPHQFLVPQKLYGRDHELGALRRAFEATCAGERTLMLVAGYAGIGKTSFIQELYRPIVRERGYFVAGKFDPVVRDIPYAAFAQAIRNLVWQLLTESEERLDRWRRRLRDALGANGGVLAEVIPEIELIVGTQPPAATLDPAEARNRFGYVFQGFVSALAAGEHPLVIFLDDLQWVDLATMDLLQALLTDPGIHHLLVIGAYRDNEVDESHALASGIGRLERAGGRVARLTLEPLAHADLVALLREAFHRDPTYVAPLATLIRQKTGGNPFFVSQFLRTLEADGLIVFDRAAAGWRFDLEAIAASSITDNVADLMTERIRRLTPAGQHVVMLAACIGHVFSRQMVLGISEMPAAEANAGLQEALDAGLIQPAAHAGRETDSSGSPNTFSFLHDRVQQAAYGRLEPGAKAPIHLRLGRLLRADLPGDGDERIFAVVNHLGLAADLITDPLERLDLARRNVAAGRKAKASTAYHAALACFDRAAALLPESAWTTDFDLTFTATLEGAECLYLTGAFAAAEDALARMLRRPLAPLDQAHVHTLRITLFENQSRWQEAIDAGRAGLRLLSVSLPDDIDTAAALESEVQAVEALVRTRPIASLIEIPDLTDATMRSVMRILTALWPPAYLTGNETLARLISATMVRLSIEHGQTEDSAYGYVTHAITVGPVRKDYRRAYEWGSLALQVNRRFDDVKRRAKIHQQFQAHVNLWTQPLHTCLDHAREATRAGLVAGDFTYAGYGAATEAWVAFIISRDLERFVLDHTPALAVLERVKLPAFADAHRVLLNWARALQGPSLGPRPLSDERFDEEQFIAAHRQTASFFLTFVFTARLHLRVLLEDWTAAEQAAREAHAVVTTGTIWPVLVTFWGGLAAAGGWTADGDAVNDQRHRIVLNAERELGELADACPANFGAMARLLASEVHRLEGRAAAAAQAAREARVIARESSLLQFEALAAEMAGRLALARGDEDDARNLLLEAREQYAAWGARLKTTHLDGRYSHLLVPVSTTAAVMSPAADPGASVDMATILKVAHAISVEIESGALVRTLLALALENAGAQRGVFLREQDGSLVLDAEADVAGRITTGEPVPLEHGDRIATSVARYVHRTGQDVVIGDAGRDERFAADPYLARHHVRSILCLPVAGQGRLRGVLYLENNLAADAFTPDRLEVMRVLAAQAAISLENARLYDEVRALKNRLEAENVYLQEEIRTQHNFNEIIGNSPVLLEALHKVERVATTDATVLILGETGAGKELFARAVHSRSRRRDRPLVKVNCGAIAPGLVESELFGHVKGAFTGAIDKRVGRFELATGGTIFLDEIGELPLDAQVKLLRVLQEQEFEPVGSSRTVRVDVRVIAATNRDLDTAVRDGRFRADLLYRLNVFPIEVPPLRARPGDLPLLAGFFVSSLARRLGKPLHGFTPHSLARLAEYSWPGNVRELQNVIERAAILAPGPVIDLAGSLLGVTGAPAAPAAPTPAQRPTRESLDEIQRVYILDVLASTGGVVEGARGAATILGLHPNTLRSRMKKLGIAAPRRADS